MDSTKDYIRMATFARELNLSPSRISQLKKRGYFKITEIDGVDHVSSEEVERFKALKRKPGRKPKIPLPSSAVAKIFLGNKDDDSAGSTRPVL